MLKFRIEFCFAEGNIIEAFGIDVFVSGFATKQHPLEQASRSQRVFIRLAKGTPHLTYSHYT
jgi:hypothetical protein